MFDILLTGANKVFDGTLNDPKSVDIGIVDDKIEWIGKDPSKKAKKTIQASHMIICPGFIDIHSHSDYFLLINTTADSHITQGVTTEVGGNCGYSAAPIWGEAKTLREAEYEKYYKLKLGWQSLSEYFDRLRRDKIGINYGHLIGHNTLRQSVMGGVNRKATPKEIEEMVQGLKQGFKEGACGLSTGLVYPPACYSDTHEVMALAKACKEAGGIFTFHMRSESDQLVEAIEEVIKVAKETGVKVQISHIKTSGQRNWNKIETVFGVIEQAKKDGVDVECDRYPYVASQTGLMQVLPEWTFEGGSLGLVKTLQDKSKRETIKVEILKQHPDQKEYFERVLIMEVMTQPNKQFEGLTVGKAAQKAKKEVFEFLFDLLIEEKAAISAIYFILSEENLKKFIQKDYIFIASDSGCRSIKGPLSKGAPHPRIFGTFPRVIKKYVKDSPTLDLKTAIHKMTLQPAKRFNLKGRGEIKVGNYADLVVFDLDKISDKADFLDPFHYCEGVEYVFVNGKLAIEKGKQTFKKFGQVIKSG